MKSTQKAKLVLEEKLEKMTENFDKTHKKLMNSQERNSELLEMYDRGTAYVEEMRNELSKMRSKYDPE